MSLSLSPLPRTATPLDLPRRRYRMVELPAGATAPYMEAFRAHLNDHPFAKHPLGGGDGSAVKISDFLTQRQFHELALYQEGFRKFGMDREIVVWFPTPPPLEINLAPHRARRDFSERERLLLNALRPHLVQAFDTANVLS